MRRRNIIDPVVNIVPDILANLGFSEEKTMMIEICVEELVAERADSSYIGSGKLWIELWLFRDFIRIGYRDDDPSLPFANTGNSMGKAAGIRILTKFSDRISFVQLDNGCYEYNLDFLYDLDFNVEENYLL